MRAVVLVGGFGTRLRPLTLTTPKQLLPVANHPMIELVVAHLARHGVTECVLSLGYRPAAFRQAFPDDTCAGVHLTYAVEDAPLDTAGAVRFAATEAGIDDTFVVVNGDVLTDLDVGALVRFHRDHEAEGTIALHAVDDPSRYGVVPTDDDGRVTAFVEKPPSEQAPTNLINAGTYVLEPSVLDRIPSGRKVSIERETFPQMVADHGLFAMSDGGAYWLDTGTPSSYLQACLDLLDGAWSSPREGAVSLEATIETGATSTHSVLGAGCLVEAGAEVVDSVLLAGAVVRTGARVERSVLGHRVEVGESAVVEKGSVLGDDVVVGVGERLVGVRRPDPEDR